MPEPCMPFTTGNCSDAAGDFQEQVYPMLSVGSGKMQIAFSDLPDFCSCVLPEVRDLIAVEDPSGLLEAYSPMIVPLAITSTWTMGGYRQS